MQEYRNKLMSRYDTARVYVLHIVNGYVNDVFGGGFSPHCMCMGLGWMWEGESWVMDCVVPRPVLIPHSPPSPPPRDVETGDPLDPFNDNVVSKEKRRHRYCTKNECCNGLECFYGDDSAIQTHAPARAIQGDANSPKVPGVVEPHVGYCRVVPGLVRRNGNWMGEGGHEAVKEEPP